MRNEREKKNSQEDFRFVSNNINRKIDQKNWVNNGIEFAGASGTVCNAEVKRTHSTMGDTEAPLAERTKQSLKNIF